MRQNDKELDKTKKKEAEKLKGDSQTYITLGAIFMVSRSNLQKPTDRSPRPCTKTTYQELIRRTNCVLYALARFPAAPLTLPHGPAGARRVLRGYGFCPARAGRSERARCGVQELSRRDRRGRNARPGRQGALILSRRGRV